MIEIRRFNSLGQADHGWLKARHHFSFADYHDPARSRWGAIRVWNDDEIAPGAGFPAHPHRDMEIVTFVRDGAISHQDSLGNHGRTEAGDVQVMSAGTGIRHAEFNAEAGPTRIFQIWIEPERKGGAPAWGTQPFPRDARAGGFVILASGQAQGDGAQGDGAQDDGALLIRADARIAGATLKAGESVDYSADPARHLYLVAASGSMDVNGVHAENRDGVAVHGETTLRVTASEDAEIILVDAV